MIVLFLLLCFSHETFSSSEDFYTKITNDGPVIIGGNITFRAVVLKGHVPQEGTYIFEWRDNMYPQNKFTEKRQGMSIWRTNHSPEKYTSGTYRVQVTVYTTDIFEWILCNGAGFFYLADHLIGNMTLQQNNTKIKENYISSVIPVQHIITLHGPDNEYLKSKATNHTIMWYIDSNLTATFKNLNGLSWTHKFKEADKSHTIMATIISDRKKNSNESSTEVDSVNSTNSSFDSKANNATDPSEDELLYSTSNITDGLCNLKTQVCGSYTRKITVKAPITNMNIAGNNWLKHGDMLSLRVTCNGSAPFDFCKRIFNGSYKVVGNETCRGIPETKLDCDFTVDYYFRESKVYTVLLILENDISKNITAFGVNIYEVTKHPQLSVVVVPLTACILAIILIIFGVAFYFQSRSSYAVEVADFDFTNNNDMEYKTFKERLAEAIHNAFNKPEDFSEDDSYNGVPSTSNKKYGSMQ